MSLKYEPSSEPESCLPQVTLTIFARFSQLQAEGGLDAVPSSRNTYIL